MRRLAAFSLIFLPFFASSQVDSAWVVNNYTKIERMIPMRDGVKLFTAIYIPKDNSEKHPMLLMRTPYGSGPYGENKYREFWYGHHAKYLKEGYIGVVQDVRGKYMSEGEYMDVRPFNKNKKGNEIDEASDTYDTIDWLIKNIENNNGKVGVTGVSYPGFYAGQAALSNHPALVAASPQAPVTDWFIGDDFHHNGAFMLMDAFYFYVIRGFGSPRPVPNSNGYNQGYQPVPKDMYKFFLETGALTNFTKLAGDTIGFWKELMNHPTLDEFWKKRNARVGMFNVKPAVLTVGGLFDAEDCFGAWQTYRAIEKQSPGTDNRIVMGPWSHGQWGARNANALGNVHFGSNTSQWYQDSIEIPFFNYHLKGKGNVDGLSEATIFFSGENVWKKMDAWPPKNVRKKTLYFHPKGKLSFSKASAGSTSYVSDLAKPVPYIEDIRSERTATYMTDDQRFAAMRPDVLVFETDELTEDITVAGALNADLRVSLTGSDADFVVKLIDVFPDTFSYGADDRYVMSGYQMLVRGEVFRGKFRNSFEKPEPFIPGRITPVKFELPDVAHVFKKGHKIMVQVQSSWFPLVDRNPQKFMDIYKAKDSDFQKATIKIHHDAANASGIVLPVMD
ncbi:MAG: CocE/NonD family hydrolase [Chitinophagaceae bacterium]|nr:CocE/NonD family hydrolase [Chitinophagaceae bacterium]